ncbi:hypothetical protein ABE169_06560 [Bacillus subtilis]
MTKEQYDAFELLQKCDLNKEKLAEAITGDIDVEMTEKQYLITDGEFYVEKLSVSINNEIYKKFILTKTGNKGQAFKFPKSQYGAALDMLLEMEEHDFYAEVVE